MSAIAALTINDGAAVPAAHTFNPAPDVMSNLAKWVDRAGGIALGYPMISFSLRQPTKASRAYKISVKVTTPILEVTSPSTATGIQPAPTLAYNLMAVTDIVLPERSTLQQRKDLFAYFKNFMGNALMTAAVENFEPVY